MISKACIVDAKSKGFQNCLLSILSLGVLLASLIAHNVIARRVSWLNSWMRKVDLPPEMVSKDITAVAIGWPMRYQFDASTSEKKVQPPGFASIVSTRSYGFRAGVKKFNVVFGSVVLICTAIVLKSYTWPLVERFRFSTSSLVAATGYFSVYFALSKDEFFDWAPIFYIPIAFGVYCSILLLFRVSYYLIWKIGGVLRPKQSERF